MWNLNPNEGNRACTHVSPRISSRSQAKRKGTSLCTRHTAFLHFATRLSCLRDSTLIEQQGKRMHVTDIRALTN